MRFAAIALLAGPLAVAQARGGGVIRVEGALLEINGAGEIPRGLFGVHAAKLEAGDVEKYGIESVRIIHQNPRPEPTRIGGGDPRAPEGLSSVVDCWFDRYQPALQLSDPRGWGERLRALARGYGQAAKAAGSAARVEFWNKPYLTWAVKPGVNYAPSFYVTEGAKPGAPMVLRETGEAVRGLEWDREVFYVLRADRTIDFGLFFRFAAADGG